MKRTTIILILALAVMAGLFLYDRANSTTTQLRATVVSVTETPEAEGPDTWRVTVQTANGAQTLSALPYRPTFKAGDSICITQVSRFGRGDTFTPAPDGTDCL